MQPNELKALLAKTDEVAIQPTHVEIDIHRRTNLDGQVYCPMGLVRAKIIKDGYRWIEKRTISVCGDQAYDIPHRNGVLVEIDPDDLNTLENSKRDHLYTPLKMTRNRVIVDLKVYPHAQPVERDGKKYIHLITSRKAVFTSWGEYALEIAKVEQEQKREEEMLRRLKDPQAALMGMTYKKFEETYGGNRSRADQIYLGAEWQAPYVYDRNGNYKRDKTGKAIRGKPVGKIDITVDRANKILEILTPEQKTALGIPTEEEATQ